MLRVFNPATIGSVLMLAAAVMVGPAAQQGGDERAAPPGDEAIPVAQASPAAPVGDQVTGEVEPSRHRRWPGRQLSPKMVEACLEVARDVDPQLANRLEKLRQETSGAEFARAIRNARYLVGLARLKLRDPTVYKLKVNELRLDAQIDDVLKRLVEVRRTESAAAEELEDHLRKLVSQQMAASIAARGMYLLRLKENMKSLEAQLAHDAENFNDAVQRRMRDLMEPLPSPPTPTG